MDGRRATPCALKHPLSAYPAGVFYYESHALLHLVRADPTMASIGVGHVSAHFSNARHFRRPLPGGECAPTQVQATTMNEDPGPTGSTFLDSATDTKERRVGVLVIQAAAGIRSVPKDHHSLFLLG